MNINPNILDEAEDLTVEQYEINLGNPRYVIVNVKTGKRVSYQGRNSDYDGSFYSNRGARMSLNRLIGIYFEYYYDNTKYHLSDEELEFAKTELAKRFEIKAL